MTLQDEVAQLFVEARDDVYRYLLGLVCTPRKHRKGPRRFFCGCMPVGEGAKRFKTLRAWIFRVAHNLGLKIRSQESSQAPFLANEELRVAGTGKDPEQSLLERERAQRFHAAVQQLSEQQRRCLFLRMQGLRYPEIGSALGISASAVGEFLRRAIVQLRKGEI